MFLIIAAIVVVGAFAIVATASAMPISPWRSLIDAEPHSDLGLSQPVAKTPREIH